MFIEGFLLKDFTLLKWTDIQNRNESANKTDDVIEENKFRGMFPFATRDFSDRVFYNDFYVLWYGFRIASNTIKKSEMIYLAAFNKV